MLQRELLLHLSLIDNVGPATIEKLTQTFLSKDNFSYLDIYSLNAKDLIYHAKLSERIAQLIVTSLANKGLLENELSLLNKHKISYITLLDSNYPPLLKSINLPPAVFYVQGQAAFAKASPDRSAPGDCRYGDRLISIVGSRQADNYAYSVIKKIVPELVKNNWTLVSGGALGADTVVHKLTLEFGGKTIVVLGSGLLKPYPAVNKSLFEKIAQSGSIISPFSLNSSALPGNFPARNRIIAGLSKACVVIQAAQSSGALITAQFALNEGREVCAVPGSIENPLSAGCHKLISEGAHLITNAEDIRLLLNDLKVEIQKKEIKFKPATIEEKILLYCDKPISFDELLIKTEIKSDELREYLWDLQLNGSISQNFIGFWHKT